MDDNKILENYEDNYSWIQNYLDDNWKISYSKQHNLAIFEKDKKWFSLSISENQYRNAI